MSKQTSQAPCVSPQQKNAHHIHTLDVHRTAVFSPATCRQEELTARLTGHSNPKLAGGSKMKAFHESPYGDDVVSGLMNHQVGENEAAVCACTRNDGDGALAFLPSSSPLR